MTFGVRYKCLRLYLTPLILAAFSFVFGSKSLAATALRIDGSTGVKPLVTALADAYQKTQTRASFEIGAGLKPDKRIEALLNNEIDVAMASHGINTGQITAKGLKVHRFAQMAVVMGVNHSIEINTLSFEQLCDIYSGKLTSWQPLGGPDVAISPFVRPFNEVDTEVLVAHIPCFAQVQVASHIGIKKKSGQMARALVKTPASLGMTTMVRVQQSEGKIKALALNGVTPQASNLLSGAYPFVRDSFLITASTPSADVGAFLAFVRSRQGSDIIFANNAIPAG